jgi:hypothetical protein
MKRQDLLNAISEVFDGAQVTALDYNWHISVATTPEKELVFSRQWVTNHIDQDGMTIEQFKTWLNITKLDHFWSRLNDGRMTRVI